MGPGKSAVAHISLDDGGADRLPNTTRRRLPPSTVHTRSVGYVSPVRMACRRHETTPPRMSVNPKAARRTPPSVYP